VLRPATPGQGDGVVSAGLLRATRAEALFASDLQPSQRPTDRAVRAAIAGSIRAFGVQGCAALVAMEYGDHPETAVRRMVWAREAVNA
jgi:hypothetical protein